MKAIRISLIAAFAVVIGAAPMAVPAQTPSAGAKKTATDAVVADDGQTPSNQAVKLDFAWIAFPDDARFKVLGLPWFDENRPLLWRLPKSALDRLPKGVVNRARIPSGGRILLRCTTTKLGLRVRTTTKGNGRGIDVYVDGRFSQSAVAENPGTQTDLVLFSGFDTKEKDIVVYLPHHQELSITAVGVDRDAVFRKPEPAFRKSAPIVFYGSSVCQGTGAYRPGMTYAAILARELGVDFVNLGFGGAGKAEKAVVGLVDAVDACCYVFDLGKSYGMQDKEPFTAMLLAVRKSHPNTPVVCITPITSSTELHSASYAERSEHTRAVMRDATVEVIKSGAAGFSLVDGMELLGFSEHDGLSRDGVHPSDYGHHVIAMKLSPTLKKALGL